MAYYLENDYYPYLSISVLCLEGGFWHKKIQPGRLGGLKINRGISIDERYPSKPYVIGKLVRAGI